MCKIILVAFILANSNHSIPAQHTILIKVGIVSVFTPFNSTVSLASRNKVHANIEGFTVPELQQLKIY